MRRALFSLICICLGSAFARDLSQWVQVRGGSWEPDATVLSSAQSELKRSFESYLGHPVSAEKWRGYTFQYQGQLTSERQKLIRVNAVSIRILERSLSGKSLDLRNDWLRVFDGGDYFFSANYDVSRNSITELHVNGPG
jgi:hypothetical protein